MSVFLCETAPLTCPRHRSPQASCKPVECAVATLDEPLIGLEVASVQPLSTPDLDERIERAIASGSTRVNESLLLDVLRFLEQNPQRWCQHVYLAVRHGVRIGCVGGWAVVLSGVAEQPGELVSSGSMHHRAQVALGLSNGQASKLFGFVSVVDAESGLPRHPTFAELVGKVAEVTGVNYKSEE